METPISQKIESFDSLYEKILDDIPEGQDPPTEDDIEQRLDELLTAGFIVNHRHEDDVYFVARPGLKWADFHDIDEPIKKTILLYLVENPNVFLVLYNTQKGKLRIAVMEMKQWSQHQSRKIVGFMIVDNDKALADQSADGVIKTLGNENVKLFTLSSNSKTTFENIKTYIDAYSNDSYNEYKMPVIVLLPNAIQNDKLILLLSHIRRRVLERQSILRYGIIVDEADKTYPMIRTKLLEYIINDEALHRIGFITATDGELLEDPECRDAYMYPIEIDEHTKQYYRAFHTVDSITNVENARGSTKTNNAYAEKILTSNHTILTTPIQHDGVQIFRKIIINSNTKTSDMASLARFALNKGMYAITFNQSGICVYRPELSNELFKIKGMRLNELLFCIYKRLGLHDKPIVIIGRRKVDRGLGFHYAPRKNQSTNRFDRQVIHWNGNANYPGGDIVSIDGEGLIWTDMILGRIEDISTAAQKAGRLAGVIGQCPQYTGQLYFWTDAHTARRIRMHNEKVDYSNQMMTGYSAVQSVNHARDMVDATPVVVIPDHEVHPELFATINLAKEWCKIHLVDSYRSSAIRPWNADGTRVDFIHGTHIKKQQLFPILNKEETMQGAIGYGVGSAARIMPVRENGTIQYIVIYKRDKKRQ